MDSLTQIVLGASVSEAVMGNKVGRKASLWGAILGTLPDLDVFIPMGNAIRDFTYHRAESHGLLYLALATPILAWLIMKIHPATKTYKTRWVLAVFLTLITHVLLDSFTVYGTQFLLPFSDYPIAWDAIFVVDPLYTIPLLLGVLAFFVFRKRGVLAKRLNTIGIILSSLYLLWGLGANWHVKNVAEKSLLQQNISVTKMHVSPSPFNTLLWRVVALTDNGYVEGIYSVFDESKAITFTTYQSDNDLLNSLADDWNVQRLQWFTKGFYLVSEQEGKIVMTDIRMGMTGMYFFNFVVGESTASGIVSAEVEELQPEEYDNDGVLKFFWQRIWDENAKV